MCQRVLMIANLLRGDGTAGSGAALSADLRAARSAMFPPDAFNFLWADCFWRQERASARDGGDHPSGIAGEERP